MRKVPLNTPGLLSHPLLLTSAAMLDDSHWSMLLGWMGVFYLNSWVKMPSSLWTSSWQKSCLSESALQTQTCLQMVSQGLNWLQGVKDATWPRCLATLFNISSLVEEVIFNIHLSPLSLIGFERGQGTRVPFTCNSEPSKKECHTRMKKFHLMVLGYLI